MTTASQPLQPLLRITHVRRAAHNVVIEFACVDRARNVVWQVSSDDFISMYHAGIRFIAGYGGELTEVFVESLPPANDAQIRSRCDTAGFRLLDRLPGLDDMDDDNEEDGIAAPHQ